MVQHDVVTVFHGDAIRSLPLGFVFISQTDTQVANNDMAGFIDLQTLICQCNAFSRRRLSGNGQTTLLVNDKFTLEANRTGHIKDDRARAPGRLNGVSQGARTGILEACHRVDISAASALSELACALCAREGDQFFLCLGPNLRAEEKRSGCHYDYHTLNEPSRCLPH